MTTYAALRFDAHGNTVAEDGKASTTDAAALHDQIVASAPTDLFVMAHGWGNSATDAESLFASLSGLIEADPLCPSGAQFVGVFWPSLWFPDPPHGADTAAITQATAAGAPGQADIAVSGKAIVDSLISSMPASTHADLKEMGNLIDAGVGSVQAGGADDAKQTQALDDFHARFSKVFGSGQVATEDAGESNLMNSSTPKDDYQALSTTMGSAPPSGDVQSIGDIFGKVWNGAKDALRVGSYYQMKGRAGDIGKKGLGPFLEKLHKDAPNTRVHLIGHSFGARLVSYTLSGISSAAASPVASLTLVQGAFSHWVFTKAEDNPFKEAGALVGFADRVHGPLAATFTRFDYAVGVWYPKASFLAGQDTEGTDPAGRWDGMGKDGYQGQKPSGDLTLPLAAGTKLAAGTFYRADANAVITDVSSGPFAGAHSDIHKAPVANLIVVAATSRA
jgi:hypothetical protein